jgi:hypothetical protein
VATQKKTLGSICTQTTPDRGLKRASYAMHLGCSLTHHCERGEMVQKTGEKRPVLHSPSCVGVRLHTDLSCHMCLTVLRRISQSCLVHAQNAFACSSACCCRAWCAPALPLCTLAKACLPASAANSSIVLRKFRGWPRSLESRAASPRLAQGACTIFRRSKTSNDGGHPLARVDQNRGQEASRFR